MVLRYWGGKASLHEWVREHFPAHKNYYEPFMGGWAVGQNKPRCEGFELATDLNPRTINFWQQLKSNPSAIYAAIADEPLAELMTKTKDDGLFEKTYDRFKVWHDGNDEPAIDAAWYYLCSLYGFLGVGVSRNSNPSPSRATSQPNILALHNAHLRLQGVDVRRQCAIETLRSLPEYDGTLIYADPPYEQKVRRTTSSRPSKKGKTPYRQYLHDADESTQVQILEALKFASDRGAMVIVSGYPNNLYSDLLAGWKTDDTEIRHYNTKKDKSTEAPIERLWLCPNVQPAQRSLFDFAIA